MHATQVALEEDEALISIIQPSGIVAGGRTERERERDRDVQQNERETVRVNNYKRTNASTNADDDD